MAITYILQLVWILIFCFLVIATFLFTIFWKMCANERVSTFQDCIDLTQFSKIMTIFLDTFLTNGTDFMFPQGTKQEHLKVCGEHDVKLFCKDYTEKIEVMVILATVASVLVILSLVSWYRRTSVK
jgi:hypothetical protein